MSVEYESGLNDAIRQGKWDVVYQEAQRWSNQDECGPLPYFALNVVCMLRGDFAEAWQVYPRAFGDEGDAQSIQKWMERLREQRSNDPNVLLFEGVFYTQSGLLEDAAVLFEQVGALAPHSPYPYFFLAQIYQVKDRIDQAIKAYREAIKRDPTYVAARLKLGVAYQEQGQLEMAIPQYREALKLRPEDSFGHTNLACALAEQGKVEPAIEEYKKALQIAPDDPEVHFALGGLYENKGRLDLAKRQYEESLRLEPNFAPAATSIGWFLYDKGQDDSAMDYFSRALKANPNDAQATFGVGRIYDEKRKPELAVQHYQRALSLEKDPDRKMRIMNFIDKLLG